MSFLTSFSMFAAFWILTLSEVFGAPGVTGVQTPSPEKSVGTAASVEAPTSPGSSLRPLITGEIRKLGDLTGPVLFHYKRTESVSDNGITTVDLKYANQDDSMAVKETLKYQNGKLTELHLDQLQLNESGEVRVTGNQLNFSYTKNGAVKTSEEALSKNDLLVCGDQIVATIVSHWDDIMAGKDYAIRYPVLDRRETVGFEFKKVREEPVGGKSAVVVRMKPSSFVIAALVDPLFFFMDKEGTHEVLRLDGRTIPKQKNGNSWKDLDATIIYKIGQ